MCLALVSVLVAAVFADTLPIDYEAHIEETDFKMNDDGSYKQKFKTSNNIKIEEESDGTNVVEGSCMYKSLIITLEILIDKRF